MGNSSDQPKQTSETGQVPWQERNALDQRNEFIREWLKGERSIAELSRIFGISRKTAYKWLERFAGARAEAGWATAAGRRITVRRR